MSHFWEDDIVGTRPPFEVGLFAPSEPVAWKVEERAEVGGSIYNTFWFGDDPERAARIRKRAERDPHVSIVPLYPTPAPREGVTEAKVALMEALRDAMKVGVPEGCNATDAIRRLTDALASAPREGVTVTEEMAADVLREMVTAARHDKPLAPILTAALAVSP